MKVASISVPLAQYLAARCSSVDAALDRWLPTAAECPAALAAAMRHAVFPGGKRLRPMLVLLACEACGGTDDAAMPAACAVELVHCYSLVHDDLPAMDDDDLRRGRPTCHKAFGEAVAILAGDALLTLGFEVLARFCETPELAAASCRELATAVGAAGMVGGQADDLAASPAPAHSPLPLGERGRGEGSGDRGSRSAALKTLQSIHSRKTGALLRVCLRLGALAGDANTVEMTALDSYGQKIGLAFQIADDLLDVHGEEAKTGKRVGKDDGCGKLTYPAILGTDESRRLARELCRAACSALEPLGPSGERLRELARFIVERDR